MSEPKLLFTLLQVEILGELVRIPLFCILYDINMKYSAHYKSILWTYVNSFNTTYYALLFTYLKLMSYFTKSRIYLRSTIFSLKYYQYLFSFF